jgi:hypothetical protein
MSTYNFENYVAKCAYRSVHCMCYLHSSALAFDSSYPPPSPPNSWQLLKGFSSFICKFCSNQHSSLTNDHPNPSPNNHHLFFRSLKWLLIVLNSYATVPLLVLSLHWSQSNPFKIQKYHPSFLLILPIKTCLTQQPYMSKVSPVHSHIEAQTSKIHARLVELT